MLLVFHRPTPRPSCLIGGAVSMGSSIRIKGGELRGNYFSSAESQATFSAFNKRAGSGHVIIPDITHTPAIPVPLSKPTFCGVMPPIAYTGRGTALHTAWRKFTPRGGTPGLQDVAKICPATRYEAFRHTASSASFTLCTEAPTMPHPLFVAFSNSRNAGIGR